MKKHFLEARRCKHVHMYIICTTVFFIVSSVCEVDYLLQFNSCYMDGCEHSVLRVTIVNGVWHLQFCIV